MLEIDVVDERLELFRIRGVQQEMLQVTAHERLVITDRRQQRPRPHINVEVRWELFPRLRLGHHLRQVPDRPRQLQVLQEPILIELAQRPIQPQPVIQRLRLERVLSGWQLAVESNQPVEIRRHRLRIVLPIFIRPRL